MVALRALVFCGVLSFVMTGDYEECFKEVGNDVEYRGLSFYSAAELEVSQYDDLEMEFEVGLHDYSLVRMIIGSVKLGFYQYSNQATKILGVADYINNFNLFFPLPCTGKISENGIYIRNSSTGSNHLLNYGPVIFTKTKTGRRVMVQLEKYGRLDFPVIRFKNATIFKPQPMKIPAPVVKKSNSTIMLIAFIVIIIASIVLSVVVGVCWYAKHSSKQPSTVKSDVKKSQKKNSFVEATSMETTETEQK